MMSFKSFSLLSRNLIFLLPNDQTNNEFSSSAIWVFPKIGVPENGWFIVESPIKMHDLGVPLFLERPIFENHTFDLRPVLCVE